MSYIELLYCRFCDSRLEDDVINLGSSYPLAGGFMNSVKEFENEEKYPLSLSFCKECKLLQCKQIINSDILFKKGYFYYSSMLNMLVKHFDEYAKELSIFVKKPNENLIVEIGCNDGVFLRPLKKYGFNVIGIDPSNTIKKCSDENFILYNDYFNEDLAKKIVLEHGKCDIILSSNSFAHIDNMNNIFKGIKELLKIDGLIIIEVHNSKKIIDELQFDFIYHEHMTYYTVTSFYNLSLLYNFTLENVKFTDIHGSSMRIYLRNKKNVDKNYENEYIENIIENEKYLNNISIYKEYNKSLYNWKYEILNILKNYKKIYGYGSSGRTNIICNFLNIDLSEIIDDAESKIGSYTPIFHKQIKSSSIIKENKPDLIIILSWPYSKDIIKNLKNIYQGKILIPLPNIKIIDC